MVISLSMFRRSSDVITLSSSFLSFVGLSRAVPRVEPPRKWMRLTSSIVSSSVWVMSPRISHLKPSAMPMTSTPSRFARMVAALITLLMPGAGPPPTRIPSFFGVMAILARLCAEARRGERPGPLDFERRGGVRTGRGYGCRTAPERRLVTPAPKALRHHDGRRQQFQPYDGDRRGIDRRPHPGVSQARDRARREVRGASGGHGRRLGLRRVRQRGERHDVRLPHPGGTSGGECAAG